MDEREREEFQRILRRLRAAGEAGPEEEPEERPENDWLDKALIVPCGGRLAGHLMDWYTSGFQ